jgi:hypothetical protein
MIENGRRMPTMCKMMYDCIWRSLLRWPRRLRTRTEATRHWTSFNAWLDETSTLLDIYVLDTDLADWKRAIGYVNRRYDIGLHGD